MDCLLVVWRGAWRVLYGFMKGLSLRRCPLEDFEQRLTVFLAGRAKTIHFGIAFDVGQDYNRNAAEAEAQL